MQRENYSRLLGAALILALFILVAFQLYINREPDRIKAVRAADQIAAITAGEELYQANCASCHGEQGEGVDAPALNNLAILKDTPDETFADLIANGMPGTEMPAWSQTRGGPFTDEEIRQLVAFIRSWEPTAPDLGEQRMQVDARRGARIYAATCVVCHGANGEGGTAPALNDPVKLQQFDDEWYAETIAKGRPAQGMPVWGSVLSPQQIGDLVALIDAWRRGEEIVVGDVGSLLKDAAHAIEHGEIGEATELLEQAANSAEHEQAEVIEEAMSALEGGNTKEAEALLKQAQGMMGEATAPEADEHGEETPSGEDEHAETVPADEHDEAAPADEHADEHNEAAPADEHADEHNEAAPADEHAEEPAATEETPDTAVDSGAAHLQDAVHALEHNEPDEATKALTEALELLPPGDLFEAAEHALEDIEAGKPDEARETLEKVLKSAE